MNIDDMQAGVEMDLEIGKLLGYEFREFPDFPGRYYIHGHPTINDTDDWSPSANIAHAWEVAALLLSRDDELGGDFTVSFRKPFWTAGFLDFRDGFALSSDADTAPLALCRVALKAVRG
jgi:hypothetical protein